MCEFSGRLVAWLDRELPEAEAANVEWHLAGCAACRQAVQSFEEVSRAFLECYERSGSRTTRRLRWIFGASGAAAAAAILAGILLWPRPVAPLPVFVLPAPHAPAIAFVRGTVAAAQTISRSRQVHAAWTPAPPVIEVELPADVLFPPGAVPEGFSFIADVRTEP